MKGEILFLAHRVPFPPDRGDKIRSHHVLKALAKLAAVHVAAFADDARDMAADADLAAIARTHCLVRRSKPVAMAGVQALLSSRPVSLAAFHSRTLADYVEAVLNRHPIRAIYVFSGQMGHYVPADFAGRVLCDFVDVDSAKFEAYAAQGSGPMRWINAREGRLLRAEEARLAGRADISLLVSEEEAALMRDRLAADHAGACDVRPLRNGIDSQRFDRAQVKAEPRLLECPGPRLIFTGQMDYPPNVAAVLLAIDRIMPLVRQVVPLASFHVVGRNPPQSLLARSGQHGCHVWGAVEDMRTWLAGADLALVPLEIARGVQNKVLEAMAMELPVVLTEGAASGIGGVDGRHFLVGRSDAEFADHVLAVLGNSARARALGTEARRFVIEELGWQASLAPLAGMLGCQQDGFRDAA
jgi:sugar transferase (PEP-CTERM/EpsH1 system associated)